MGRAEVMELVDMRDSKSRGASLAGSIPALGTTKKKRDSRFFYQTTNLGNHRRRKELVRCFQVRRDGSIIQHIT